MQFLFLFFSPLFVFPPISPQLHHHHYPIHHLPPSPDLPFPFPRITSCTSSPYSTEPQPPPWLHTHLFLNLHHHYRPLPDNHYHHQPRPLGFSMWDNAHFIQHSPSRVGLTWCPTRDISIGDTNSDILSNFHKLGRTYISPMRFNPKTNWQ